MSSVRGASHERSGAPNQDSGRAVPFEQGTAVILAVADGHGDSLHARSDRGSRFAVEAAVGLLTEWIENSKKDPDAAAASLNRLPGQIVAAWGRMVAADLAAHPPHDEIAAAPQGKTELIRRSPDILYGSTLLGAALHESAAAYIQIGDGDLLTVAADGSVRRAAPGRDDLPVNQTESLCQADAGERFRVEYQSATAEQPLPVLVLAATDGYANSFSDDAGFLKVAADLNGYLVRQGIQWIARHLDGWLEETSRNGSGDDITLALAWSGTPTGEEPEDAHKAPWWRPLAIATLALLVSLSIGWSTWRYAPPGVQEWTTEIWRSVAGAGSALWGAIRAHTVDAKGRSFQPAKGPEAAAVGGREPVAVPYPVASEAGRQNGLTLFSGAVDASEYDLG